MAGGYPSHNTEFVGIMHSTTGEVLNVDHGIDSKESDSELGLDSSDEEDVEGSSQDVTNVLVF